MKVIIINGHAESGKSTFVEMCKSYPDVNVYEFSMIDAAKEMAEIIGWDESQKSPRDRKFLSDLKDLVDIYNDGSYQYVKFNLDNLYEYRDAYQNLIVFIHAREPEDIERFVKEYNAKTLVIRRKFVEDQGASNHADANWWQYTYDYAVSNNGQLEHLKKNSENFMEHILSEDWGYGN